MIIMIQFASLVLGTLLGISVWFSVKPLVWKIRPNTKIVLHKETPSG